MTTVDRPTATAPITTAAATERSDDTQPEELQPIAGSLRTDLGLPSDGHQAGDLPALTEAQWSNPSAVAVRYVLADTNYSPDEQSAAAAARRNVHASEYLATQPGNTASGAAMLEEQRRHHAVFVGEILGVAGEVAGDRATVTLTVRRSALIDGRPAAPPRIGFQRLVLVRQPSSGRWLVVAVTLS